MHCPAGTKHVIVGAGDGSCVLLAVGARDLSMGADWGGYTVDEAALRHRAGVEEETTEAAHGVRAIHEARADRVPRGLASGLGMAPTSSRITHRCSARWSEGTR